MQYKRIRDLREDHDLTQKEVGEYLFMAQTTYSRYERGTVPFSADILCSLADLYHVSVDYLLGRTDNPAPYEK